MIFFLEIMARTKDVFLKHQSHVNAAVYKVLLKLVRNGLI